MIKCNGKIKYLTEEAAELNIEKMRNTKKTRGDTKTLNSYKCPHCGFWHVGHAKYLRKIK